MKFEEAERLRLQKIKLDEYEAEWKRKLENEQARIDALRKSDEENDDLMRKRI